jgi:hypothetical protein
MQNSKLDNGDLTTFSIAWKILEGRRITQKIPAVIEKSLPQYTFIT